MTMMTRTMTGPRLLLLWLALALAAPLDAQQPPPAIDVAALGPKIGESIPDFRVPDQHGRLRTRDSLMGPKGLMLVFSRSADWCPFCKTQIAELQSRVPVLEREGLGVAVITYDSPAVLADFAARRGITFPLLADQGSSTIKAYGILNTNVDSTSSNFGIPYPGTFIVDRQGRVTARFFEPAYQERNTVASILLKLGGKAGAVEARRIATDQLDADLYLSDTTAAPGTLFSVVADVTPKPGMHVYAPGAHSYRVVKIVVDPQPFLTIRPTAYPPSEIYLFKPLNERVEVYQAPFRLTADLSLSTAADARKALASVSHMTITGRFEFQVCSDTVCFVPQSVPLSLDIEVRALDTDRSGASTRAR